MGVRYDTNPLSQSWLNSISDLANSTWATRSHGENYWNQILHLAKKDPAALAAMNPMNGQNALQLEDITANARAAGVNLPPELLERDTQLARDRAEQGQRASNESWLHNMVNSAAGGSQAALMQREGLAGQLFEGGLQGLNGASQMTQTTSPWAILGNSFAGSLGQWLGGGGLTSHIPGLGAPSGGRTSGGGNLPTGQAQSAYDLAQYAPSPTAGRMSGGPAIAQPGPTGMPVHPGGTKPPPTGPTGAPVSTAPHSPWLDAINSGGGGDDGGEAQWLKRRSAFGSGVGTPQGGYAHELR